ncbi:hypothetical protein SAMN05443572_102288 [Myxococcus fulvus]|uniref:Lipoprotein n=1 Tax=Myxococcus fulvus TaxID=33 RepID=A0A511SXG5_MYXFU|nr:hypothetical protein [Myxococcus fulvus]GEN06601.1 hypothetical protein MFU01_16380 [Myxococcus fulvus]SET44140.1 hypothetical protein SAMN05443572_102288 [Myxococcus fulvus]
MKHGRIQRAARVSGRRGLGVLACCLGLVLSACREEKPAQPLQTLKPEPLPSLSTGSAADDAGAEPRVDVPVHGEKLPSDALRMTLAGEQVRVDAETFEPTKPDSLARLASRVKGRDVLLVPDADTFLAQVSELLAVLRDSAGSVWLAHPDAPVAYRLVLRDEEGFREWLAEVAPGKLRIIQRADGFELSTSVGKLPGPDANGPSVPVREGRQDLAMLRRGLGLLKGRFKQSEDICLVPSFGTEVAQAARALGAVYTAPSEPLFETLCLVYPTPRRAGDAG